MKEILITSSVLIAALLLLRLVFSKKVSRTLIYGAWILVALRLLIPVQIGQLQFSVLTAAQDVKQTMEQVETRPVSGPSKQEVYQDIVVGYVEKDQSVFVPQVQEQIREEISQGTTDPADIADKIQQKYPQQEIFVPQVEQQVQQQVEQTPTAPTLGQIAKTVWLMGVAGMALWFLTVNLRHGWLLRRTARKLDCQSPIPVYVSDQVASPCLVGLLRPVVYVTARCAGDQQLLRHVLNHELTHYRHGDHIWSLVRCVCLCVYWFDPLVWAAAYFSRRDCELACDEGAMKGLDEAERLAYGKTLLEVVSHAAGPGNLLQTATSMNETMKQLKERVSYIVKKPKISITAVICMVLICAMVAGCVAAGPTGTQSDPPATTQPDSTQPAEPTPQDPKELLAMIPEEIQQRIKDEYLTRFYSQYPEDPKAIDNTSLRVFGVFGDSYALFVDGPFCYAQVISRGTFGLIYPNSQNMYVYRDGQFYCDLETVGILTDEEIQQVIANYYATYPALQELLPTGPKPTDPQPAPTTQPNEPINEELAKFNALFGNLDSLYNKALTCEYETPAQLGLMYFFLSAYNGSDKEATDAERAQLKDIYGYGEYIDCVDIKRLPVDWMNHVLTELFGITLEDVEEAGFYDMDYLESTNCYYIVGNGASAAMDFNALSVEHMDDGSVRVYYTQFTGSENEMFVVTLMPHGDGYRILSNVALPAVSNVDWDMEGTLVLVGGTVEENTHLSVQGTIRDQQNGTFVLVLDIAAADDFRYRFQMPEPNGYTSMNRRYDCKDYYVFMGYTYDIVENISVMTYFALDTERECIIIHWEDGSGRYLVASADSNMDANEIMEHFAEFRVKYSPSAPKPWEAEPTFFPETLLAQLSDDTRQQILGDYCAEMRDVTPDMLSLRVFGIFEDAYVLFVDGLMHPASERTEVVENYKFCYSDLQKLLVYYAGQFYSLQDAITAQVITTDDLQTVFDNYYSAYPLLWVIYYDVDE